MKRRFFEQPSEKQESEGDSPQIDNKERSKPPLVKANAEAVKDLERFVLGPELVEGNQNKLLSTDEGNDLDSSNDEADDDSHSSPRKSVGAWADSDDERVTVDLRSVLKLRKLRRITPSEENIHGSEVISGKELTDRFRDYCISKQPLTHENPKVLNKHKSSSSSSSSTTTQSLPTSSSSINWVDAVRSRKALLDQQYPHQNDSQQNRVCSLNNSLSSPSKDDDSDDDFELSSRGCPSLLHSSQSSPSSSKKKRKSMSLAAVSTNSQDSSDSNSDDDDNGNNKNDNNDEGSCNKHSGSGRVGSRDMYKSNFFNSNMSIVGESNHELQPHKIAFRSLPDANKKLPSGSVVRVSQFVPGTDLLYTSGVDKTIRIFNIDRKDNPLVSSTHLTDCPIRDSKATYLGTSILYIGGTKSVGELDIATGNVSHLPSVSSNKSHSRFYRLVTCGSRPANSSKCAATFAVSAANGYVMLFDLRSKSLVKSIKSNSPVTSLVYHPNSERLLTGDEEGMVNEWDVGMARCVSNFRDEGSMCVTSMAVGDTYLAVGSRSGFVNIYDITNPPRMRIEKDSTGGVGTSQ